MAEDWKIQYNFKVGETLVNLRAQDSAEAAAVLAAFKDALNEVAEVTSIIKQVGMTKGLTSFTPAPPASAPATQHAAPAAGATATDLRCVHGPYVDKKGKRKQNGQPYQFRYFCSQFTGGCKASDLPGQQSWSE